MRSVIEPVKFAYDLRELAQSLSRNRRKRLPLVAFNVDLENGAPATGEKLLRHAVEAQRSRCVGGRDTLHMFHTPKMQTPLNLGNMFHKTTMPSWPMSGG